MKRLLAAGALASGVLLAFTGSALASSVVPVAGLVGRARRARGAPKSAHALRRVNDRD